jgi:hypothetical protein
MTSNTQCTETFYFQIRTATQVRATAVRDAGCKVCSCVSVRACVRVSLHVSSYLACNTELMSRNITQGDEEIICTNLYVHYYIYYEPY